jgi:PIN domain nuclease of toxin-antitoxin system
LSGRLLLDTHIFVTAALEGFEALSPRARKALKEFEAGRVFSTISMTEIAIKTIIGKLAITDEQLLTGITDMRLTVLPYTRGHAMQMFDLPLHHGDPFDRMLIATALTEDIPILSADTLFREYKGLRVIRA